MTTTTAPMTARTDQDVIDAIATLLGTRPEWDGAEELEDIANLIGSVRPHPGDRVPAEYRRAFKESTGRKVDDSWDFHDDDDDYEYVCRWCEEPINADGMDSSGEVACDRTPRTTRHEPEPEDES